MTNGETIKHLFERVNVRDLAAVQQLLTDDFVRHDLADLFPGVTGPGGVRDFLSMLVAAAPDLQLHIEDVIEQGDRCAVRFHLTGTHSAAELLGQAATGRAIYANGVNVYRFEGERIAETWQMVDGLALHRAAGLID